MKDPLLEYSISLLSYEIKKFYPTNVITADEGMRSHNLNLTLQRLDFRDLAVQFDHHTKKAQHTFPS